jgi:hypothetical protein
MLVTRLTAIATELSTTVLHPIEVADPIMFLTHLFWYLSNTMQPITRTGMDRMMEVLFAAAPFSPLLEDPDTHQAALTPIINQMSELLKAHWEYIIIPAWNQHAEIKRLTDLR